MNNEGIPGFTSVFANAGLLAALYLEVNNSCISSIICNLTHASLVARHADMLLRMSRTGCTLTHPSQHANHPRI